MTALFLGTFAGSLALSFILTKLVRDKAVRRGWIVRPVQERHLHSRALPRLGGVAILVSFLVAVTVSLICGNLFGADTSSLQPLATMLPPAFLIFLLGLYDDLRGAGPYLKFSIQALSGAMLFAGGLRILDLPVLFGSHQFSWYTGLPLTMLWVVAITNAFNLIDGLDGLAAGSALFSTLVMFVVALLSNLSLISLLTLALAGAILGFLRYNFNPATIFLGDCGSLFIGFMLSAMALYGAQKATTIIAVAIPVVSFGLPILETSLSVVRRFISGRPVFTADREHIHHKLLQRGMSHRQVVILLYGVSAIFALLSLFLLWPTGSTLGLVLAVLGTGIWIGVQHLGYLEFGEIRRVAQRTIEQRQIFVNNLAIRRATEELRLAEGLPQVCKILTAAFESNDFDEFELRAEIPQRGFHVMEPGEVPCFLWRKSAASADAPGMWSITLNLLSTQNHHCGSLAVLRRYTSRDLQLDVNLLTSGFVTALADALQRSSIENVEFISLPQAALLSAQVS